jgi:hypothetical protein
MIAQANVANSVVGDTASAYGKSEASIVDLTVNGIGSQAPAPTEFDNAHTLVGGNQQFVPVGPTTWTYDELIGSFSLNAQASLTRRGVARVKDDGGTGSGSLIWDAVTVNSPGVTGNNHLIFTQLP